MKFALVNGERREAEKGVAGICVGCEQPMISKCGLINVKHWAHRSKCECDHWWENETEWHRTWKNHFPIEFQEIRHKSNSGEWHIADVVTKQGTIIEFQHSFLKPEERQARNNFYGTNLVWVIDGLKRKTDWLYFDKIINASNSIFTNSPIRKISLSIDNCPLLRDWSECAGSVFFDFGTGKTLWCLLPKSSRSMHYLAPFSHHDFIALQNGSLTTNGHTFTELMAILNFSVLGFESPQQMPQHQKQVTVRPFLQRQISPPQNLSQRYMNYLNRTPRRNVRL